MFRNSIQKANQKFVKRFLYFFAGISPFFATWLAFPLSMKSLQAADSSTKPRSELNSFKQDLKKTIAQASETGKPLLTTKSINEIISISGDSRSPAFNELAQEAQGDLKTFITSRFSLTPQQLRGLQALNREDLTKVQNAIKEAQQTGTPLRLRFLPVDGNTSRSKPDLQVTRERITPETTNNLAASQPNNSDLICRDCEIIIVISIGC